MKVQHNTKYVKLLLGNRAEISLVLTVSVHIRSTYKLDKFLNGSVVVYQDKIWYHGCNLNS